MKLHILNTQNALKISMLISLLYSYYSSSTTFSLCYAISLQLTQLTQKCQNQLAGSPNKGGGLDGN